MSPKTNVIQVVGYRNSGKTTLLCGLISKLTERGFRVGTVKHDAHGFEIDRPGKDTWQHRQAGAETVAITSKGQTAIMKRHATTLEWLLHQMEDHDIILVEGFKFADYPKIVVIRTEDHLPLLQQAANIMAVVTWIPIQESHVSVFDKNDVSGIYTHVRQYVKDLR